MAKSKQIAGDGFIVSDSKKPSRAGVKHAMRRLTGPSSGTNFLLRISDEKQLADFAARRVRTTALKLMTSLAVAYSFSMQKPRMVVGGARLQDVRGNSRRVVVDGKSYLVGTEAAHFGIGTLWRGSDSVSREVYHRLNHANAQRTGGQSININELFPSSSALVAALLAYDASTYLAPAFLNQVEGSLEAKKQHFMLGLMSTETAKNQNDLERDLRVIGSRLVDLFLKHKVVVDPIDQRLLAINQGAARTFDQSPLDLENYGLCGGKETELLQVMRGEAASKNSQTTGLIQRLGSDVVLIAGDIAEMAEASKEEFASLSG